MAASMIDHSLASVRLTELESVIDGGMKTFVEVGTALAEIRDSKLYRAGHATFDDYCKARWGFNRQRAYQIIEAAVVTLEMSKNLDTTPPTKDSHARALLEVAPEHRAETWNAVVAERGDAVRATDIQHVAHVLHDARTQPDGAMLIEQVTSGNWDIAEVKKELTHRGVVGWGQPTNVTAMPRWVDKLPEETVDKLAASLYRIQLPDMVSQVVLLAQKYITEGSRKAQKELDRIDWSDVSDEMRSDEAITDAIYFMDAELGRFAESIGRARLTQPGIRSVK